MKTIVNTSKKRKIIDLDTDTFRILSIKAAAKGTNLKHLIENYLKGIADNVSDSELYTYLVKERPDGKEMLKSGEKANFENWLGV